MIVRQPVDRSHPLRKIERARKVVATNGLRWTAWAALFGGLQRATHFTYERMVNLEQKHGLRGRNSLERIYRMYQEEIDWSHLGEQWTPSEEWKQALIDEVMLGYLEGGTTILEIGPGAGRFSVALQRLAGHLILVDLSDYCIELCRRRFAGAENVEFHVNDGRTLPAIPDRSVDGVWSFDVFVHIAPQDVEALLDEICRVLRPKGRAVIHHPKSGHENVAAEAGWRSSMTAALFAGMVRARGMTMVAQFDSWGGGRYDVRKHGDVISVFTR